MLSFPSIDNPTSIKTASFIDIRNLYAEESKQPLKLAHKLTQKSLAPKNIEKTSVKLSNAIFHESTLHALQYFNENQGKQWTGTADFVEIVLKMWKIVNVKTPSIGQHKKDLFREPISMISNCIILKNLLSLLKPGIVADCLAFPKKHV